MNSKFIVPKGKLRKNKNNKNNSHSIENKSKQKSISINNTYETSSNFGI